MSCTCPAREPMLVLKCPRIAAFCGRATSSGQNVFCTPCSYYSQAEPTGRSDCIFAVMGSTLAHTGYHEVKQLKEASQRTHTAQSNLTVRLTILSSSPKDNLTRLLKKVPVSSHLASPNSTLLPHHQNIPYGDQSFKSSSLPPSASPIQRSCQFRRLMVPHHCPYRGSGRQYLRWPKKRWLITSLTAFKIRETIEHTQRGCSKPTIT